MFGKINFLCGLFTTWRPLQVDAIIPEGAKHSHDSVAVVRCSDQIENETYPAGFGKENAKHIADSNLGVS